MYLRSNLTVLFQGDSITDANRKRKIYESLGEGYVMMTAAWISAQHPEFGAKFINRGEGGNRIRDLKTRWKKDCLDLKPDLVSILVGINDAHGKPCWSAPTSLESFEADYRGIVEQTLRLGEVQIVLMEPFLLPSNPNYAKTDHVLAPMVEVVKNLSKEFKTLLLPLNDIFMKAFSEKNKYHWSVDGVHPTLAGHALIAQSWIKEVITSES